MNIRQHALVLVALAAVGCSSESDSNRAPDVEPQAGAVSSDSTKIPWRAWCEPNGHACDSRWGSLYGWGNTEHRACGVHVNNCGASVDCGGCFYRSETCQTGGEYAGYCTY